MVPGMQYSATGSFQMYFVFLMVLYKPFKIDLPRALRPLIKVIHAFVEAILFSAHIFWTWNDVN